MPPEDNGKSYLCADEHVCNVRKHAGKGEANGVEAELTRRAREVLAGLSGVDAAVLLKWVADGGEAAWWEPEHQLLDCLLINDVVAILAHRLYLTDLGRECARMLLEVARG